MDKSLIRKLYNVAKTAGFPVLLLLFALLKVNKGINLADTAYTLGNVRFFPESSGVWFLLTFVSNAIGYVMTLLPFGGTMLGMKVYTSLVIALMGLLGYRFFMTKMPAWLAFLAEVAAIGMCWAPSGILYHYLTYMFLLLGAILIFRALAGDRKNCLVLAGVSLGINAFVRFPNNGLEVLLIIPLILYRLKQKKPGKDILKEILLCVAGYFGAFLVMLLAVSLKYGWDALPQMLNGVAGISGSASDYTFSSMIFSVLDAYWHGLKWGLYIIICTIMGIPFFFLYREKAVKARKAVYCACIVLLLIVLERWGMFNFKYYQKESALIPGTIFLLISIGVCIWMEVTRKLNEDWKLIGLLAFVIILITPLGSNNHIWPLLNSLFFVAPVTAWIVYRFVRWGPENIDVAGNISYFPAKSMLAACCILFLIQSLGVGVFYVFADGEDGTPVDAYVSDNDILKGMQTTKPNADSLSELSRFMKEKEVAYEGKKLVLYGNIPGVSYILDRPSAINTTWADLDSNPAENMKESLESAGALINGEDSASRPLIIISRIIYEYPDNSVKYDMLLKFIEKYEYVRVFDNDAFVVYE